jgi:hypothetical protein
LHWLETTIKLSLTWSVHLRPETKSTLRHELVALEATLELTSIWHLVELILLVHHAIIIHWAPHRHSHLTTHVWVVTLVLHLLLRISKAILIVLTVLALALASIKGSAEVIGIEFLPTEIVHLLDNLYVRNVINYDF